MSDDEPSIWHEHDSVCCFQVINNINFYYDAQKVGSLPNSVLGNVNWLRSSLSQELTSGPLGRDVSGGWLTGGQAFSTKEVIPTAFSVTMMAWSLIRYLSPPIILQVHMMCTMQNLRVQPVIGYCCLMMDVF